MTEVYSFLSDTGDEYKLQFTTERSGIIAGDILDYLEKEGIEVADYAEAQQCGAKFLL